MLNSGQDYSSVPTPLFFGRSQSKNLTSRHVDASGEALMSFSVSGANMLYSGENYIGNTDGIVVGGGGAGAMVSGLTGDPNNETTAGKITGVKIINAGSGYSSAPIFTFPGNLNPTNGKVATGIATLKSGFVTGVAITNSGIYHLNQPYFSGFVGGSPSVPCNGRYDLNKLYQKFHWFMEFKNWIWFRFISITIENLITSRAKELTIKLILRSR